MLGQNHNRDRATGSSDRPGYDAIGRFGAGALYGDTYGDVTAFPYTVSPQNLHASNKPSEHNIANMLPRIVVAQLGAQTQPRAFKKTLSRSIQLRPGNSSLGGT